MSSRTYTHSDYDSDCESDTIQSTYEEQEEYLTYDEEMAAYDTYDNIFEDDDYETYDF